MSNSWHCCEWLLPATVDFFFWRIFSTCLPTSGWVINKCTCPHHAECGVDFDQNGITSMPYPPYSPNLILRDFLFVCLFPWMKKVLKGKHIANMEEVKPKKTKNKQKKKQTQKTNGRITKRQKIEKFKSSFEQWKKHHDKCIASNGEYFEGEWSLNM